jgi:hypothetical protein
MLRIFTLQKIAEQGLSGRINNIPACFTDKGVFNIELDRLTGITQNAEYKRGVQG